MKEKMPKNNPTQNETKGSQNQTDMEFILFWQITLRHGAYAAVWFLVLHCRKVTLCGRKVIFSFPATASIVNSFLVRYESVVSLS